MLGKITTDPVIGEDENNERFGCRLRRAVRPVATAVGGAEQQFPLRPVQQRAGRSQECRRGCQVWGSVSR